MECSVTALSSIAESCKEHFDPYYEGLMQNLMKFLTMDLPKEYKQFKGQLIETITMISISVSKELLLKY